MYSAKLFKIIRPCSLDDNTPNRPVHDNSCQNTYRYLSHDKVCTAKYNTRRYSEHDGTRNCLQRLI